MNRNRDLFWKLIEPEHYRARSYCRKLTGNRDDGDDLYQDALVAALKGFSGLKDLSAARPWLYRIIINTWKNRLRQPWWKKIVPFTGGLESVLGSHDPEPRHTARRRLETAFRVLTPEDKALVTLFELQGFSIAEAAKVLGKSEGNIRVRLTRARRKMRRELIRHFEQNFSGEFENLMGVNKRYALSRSPKETD